MRVLRCRLGFIDLSLIRIIFRAVFFADIGFCRICRFIGNTERVGSHIGDQTVNTTIRRTEVHAFIKLLRDLHRAFGMKAETTGRHLLKARRFKRRLWAFVFLGAFGRFDGKFRFLASGYDLLCIFAGCKLDLTVFIAVEFGFDLLVFGKSQNGFDGPIFLGNEFFDLRIAFYDDPRRNGLYAACGKSALDRFPKIGADLLSHDSVEDSTRLLRVDEIHIDGMRFLDTALYGLFGDLIERNAICVFGFNAEDGRKMPRDGFPFSVRVSCDIYFICVLCFLFHFRNERAFALDVDIFYLEIVLRVDAETAFRQISDMTLARNDFIIAAKIRVDGGNLTGGFQYH